jgi:hypothetical protein
MIPCVVITTGSSSSAPARTVTPFVLALSALLPLLVAVTLCVWWTRGGYFFLSGDEPHYLIMARSVWLDGDFDLHNNYVEDAISSDLYGEITPHAYRETDVWPPYHSPGLGLLLAVPLRYYGINGTRLMLTASVALISLPVFLWLAPRLSAIETVLISVALAFSIPLAYGASRIYPDLPATAIVTAAALACLTFEHRRAVPPLTLWIGMWTLVGLLPWLQSRFLAVWGLLMLAGSVLAFRAVAGARVRLLAGLLPSIALIVALGVFNQHYYGNPFGPPRWSELTTSPARATMIFLGLHLDQSQGLFLQQPVWVLALPGLVPFALARPLVAAWWALLYLAIVLPGAMQLGRYGGGGPVGRYAWAAAFLWVVPLRYWLERLDLRRARWLRLALAVIVLLQLAAAWRWIAAPRIVVPKLEESLTVRESLATEPLRSLLPSFYFWDFTSYWFYWPNVAAIAGVTLLIIWGAIQARDRSRARPSRE